MGNITFEIKKRVEVLSENENGFSKQVNYVSWNGGRPQLDIRMWRILQDKPPVPLKGILLNDDEVKVLIRAIEELESVGD